MSYKKATQHLPEELLRQVQQYVDGEYLYIPRVSERRREWGEGTQTRMELTRRNAQIYAEYLAGCSVSELAQRHFLSEKSIQRIIAQEKKACQGG